MIYPKNPYCPFDKDYMCPGHGNNGNNNNNTNNNKPGNGTGGNMGGTGNVNPGTGNNNMGNGNMGNGNVGGGNNIGNGNVGGGNNIGNGNIGGGNTGNGNMGNGNIGNGGMGNGNSGNGNDCMWPGTGNGSNNGTGDMNRNELMNYICELEFALTDLKLYLDTHPDNAQALEMFTKLAATLKSLKSDYARRFAPITAMDAKNQTPFEWVSPEHKWPWQA